jgi:hypothetical protein
MGKLLVDMSDYSSPALSFFQFAGHQERMQTMKHRVNVWNDRSASSGDKDMNDLLGRSTGSIYPSKQSSSWCMNSNPIFIPASIGG